MKITADKILFFDFDGTLIDTDYANWLAYSYANEHIITTKAGLFLNPRNIGKDGTLYFGYSIDYFNHLLSFGEKRIDKKQFQDKDIVEYKQEIEKEYIKYTHKIEENISILKRFSKKNKIILVSNCRKARGLETLKYHKLDGYFYKMFFAEDKTLSENKYENAIKLLNLSPDKIIAFEDCEEEIERAKEAGIQYINIENEISIKDILDDVFSQSTTKTLVYHNPKSKLRIEIDNDVVESILQNKEQGLFFDKYDYSFYPNNDYNNPIQGTKVKIRIDGLKDFIIEPNNFLKQEIKAFYHRDYYGGGSGNWDTEGKIEFALWSLKNDDGCKNSHKEYLATAYKWIKNILLNDLPKIKEKIAVENLVVCVVPRAKEGFVYREDQLLFRKAVSDIVDKLGKGFVNGAKYLVRHTTTKTTHLRYNGVQEGNEPYIGITKDTCYISDNVEGKDILLIDDIYTKSININEDAIQALLDKGAKSVHFYAIGKTYSNK